MSAESARVPTLKDDASHFPQYADNPHAFWYTEWWYLNFQDASHGLSGEVTFAVFNQGDHLDLGVSSLNSVFISPDGVVTSMDYHGLDKYSASTEQADVTLAGNELRVIDENTYHVRSTTNDGKISFDLTFAQADAPQYLVDDDSEGWAQTSWLVYMPCARVSGTAVVDGKTYELSGATGYHDHDWGVWEVAKKTWSWADVSSPEDQFTFVLAQHGAFASSIAYVRFGDLRLNMPDTTFKIKESGHGRWGMLWEYPTQIDFAAQDATGRYKIECQWNVLETATLWHYPLIVFEQTAHFTGGLYEKDASTGEWKQIYEIDLDGFCEATDKWTDAKGIARRKAL